MDMMEGFYHPFHGRIEEKKETVTRDEAVNEKYSEVIRTVESRLGKHGRYGPMVQIGKRKTSRNQDSHHFQKAQA
ncbi:MAG: hypothetical protein Ct9H90mP9_0030 [Pseudomonadota bacterium]|nr:MAG: hypothetical protein Ct9H90mP9_0030 [Pseudomonadota bacterium]